MTSPMGMQPTGVPYMQAQPTGFMQPQLPQATGFMQAQPTGMSPFGNQHAVSQSGMVGGGGGGGAGFNPVPSRFTPSPAGQHQQQQPIQFNPMPPNSSSTSSSHGGGASNSSSSSSKAAQFEPGNIFSSMKDGTFASGSVKLPPQDASRYDALRAQPTGMGTGMGQGMGMGMGHQGMQPQMTGYPQAQPQQQQMQMPMQNQMTGFPGMMMPQQQQQPQMTGFPGQQQGYMRQVSGEIDRGHWAIGHRAGRPQSQG